MEKEYKYYAFISYNWDDKKWARWLQRKLENYRLPSFVRKQYPNFPKKFKVFRDGTDIRPDISLQHILREELENSKYLIVICSPHSAQSNWVGKEINEFIMTGKRSQIILLIVDGIPYSDNPATECYHTVIKQNFPEILGADIHEQGNEFAFTKREKAFIRVIAGMLGLSFDVLWNRYRRYLIQKVTTYILILIVFLVSTSWIWYSNQPFDLEIALEEVTYHNENLPFEEGNIKLILSNDTLRKTITNQSELIVFKNIPGKYKYKNIRTLVQIDGYFKTDTLLRSCKMATINIARDSTWATLAGVVYNDNLETIKNIHVKMQNGLSSLTDEHGKFEITIPLAEQSKYVNVVFSNEEYFDKHFKNSLVSRNWKVILTKKIK